MAKNLGEAREASGYRFFDFNEPVVAERGAEAVTKRLRVVTRQLLLGVVELCFSSCIAAETSRAANNNQTAYREASSLFPPATVRRRERSLNREKIAPWVALKLAGSGSRAEGNGTSFAILRALRAESSGSSESSSGAYVHARVSS